jgi:hypothetical protein
MILRLKGNSSICSEKYIGGLNFEVCTATGPNRMGIPSETIANADSNAGIGR